ncbi:MULTISPECIES: hypothetical protein [Escherichia]|uniref:hypothetical protein n=1 Tax=Escherichia TaxID=561 RepID=UPI001FAAD50B|nr:MULTISPECIES: hypothetical protein [Escherichia]
MLDRNALKVSHIPDVAGDEKCSVIRKLQLLVCLNIPSATLKIFILSKNEEITSFSLYPFHCLESLDIPAVTDILWANIDDFILSVYIESDEIDRITEFLWDFNGCC